MECYGEIEMPVEFQNNEKTPLDPPPATWRVGVVEGLVTFPLTCGLAQRANLEVVSLSPEQRQGALARGEVDVALLSTLDLLAIGSEAVILPAGCVSLRGVGCSGWLWSHDPIEQLETVQACSSRATMGFLAQLIWAEEFGHSLTVQLSESSEIHPGADGMIVSCPLCRAHQWPAGFGHVRNLGAMWFTMTGLPFVSWVWAARAEADLGAITQILAQQLEENLANLSETCGIESAWRAECLRAYFRRALVYSFREEQIDGLVECRHRALRAGVISESPTLRFFTGATCMDR